MRRTHGKPLIIGLTGSIGMGKSTLARQFARLGAMVLDSDKVVHQLLGKGGKAVAAVGALFPQALERDAIDRSALGRLVFADTQKLKALEAILHPLVRRAQEAFIRRACKAGKAFVVLDIPLLFETGAQKRCDVTVVAHAPAFVQRQRVFARAHMTEEKFRRILALQMPDAQKRARADFVVYTGLGRNASLRQLKRILLQLKKKYAKKSR